MGAMRACARTKSDILLRYKSKCVFVYFFHGVRNRNEGEHLKTWDDFSFIYWMRCVTEIYIWWRMYSMPQMWSDAHPIRYVCSNFSVDNDTCYLDLMSIIDDCCVCVCVLSILLMVVVLLLSTHPPSFYGLAMYSVRYVYVFTSNNRAITHLVKQNV